MVTLIFLSFSLFQDDILRVIDQQLMDKHQGNGGNPQTLSLGLRLVSTASQEPLPGEHPASLMVISTFFHFSRRPESVYVKKGRKMG